MERHNSMLKLIRKQTSIISNSSEYDINCTNTTSCNEHVLFILEQLLLFAVVEWLCVNSINL